MMGWNPDLCYFKAMFFLIVQLPDSLVYVLLLLCTQLCTTQHPSGCTGRWSMKRDPLPVLIASPLWCSWRVRNSQTEVGA